MVTMLVQPVVDIPGFECLVILQLSTTIVATLPNIMPAALLYTRESVIVNLGTTDEL
jgi:hypothetical protein